jgi:hypothetical protein
MDARLKEAEKLGFTAALLPERRQSGSKSGTVSGRSDGIVCHALRDLGGLTRMFEPGQGPIRIVGRA